MLDVRFVEPPTTRAVRHPWVEHGGIGSSLTTPNIRLIKS